ncbi:hypothetical protein Tco_0766137 [Tanacetum coccineum]
MEESFKAVSYNLQNNSLKRGRFIQKDPRCRSQRRTSLGLIREFKIEFTLHLISDRSFVLFSKQDAKPRLIRWHLLLQGFNIEIKDKKGAENLAAAHLSRLKNPNIGKLAEEEIDDKFPGEHLMILKTKLNDEEPWFTIIDDDDMIRDVVLGMKFCKKYASCQMIMKKFALRDKCEQIMEDE